jgi:hypothetical protein
VRIVISFTKSSLSAIVLSSTCGGRFFPPPRQLRHGWYKFITISHSVWRTDMSQGHDKVQGTKAKCDEPRIQLPETAPVFYFYDRMPQSRARNRLR